MEVRVTKSVQIGRELIEMRYDPRLVHRVALERKQLRLREVARKEQLNGEILRQRLSVSDQK